MMMLAMSARLFFIAYGFTVYVVICRLQSGLYESLTYSLLRRQMIAARRVQAPRMPRVTSARSHRKSARRAERLVAAYFLR